MRTVDNGGRFDNLGPRWGDEPQPDAVGPQGEALILELQRLRQAFEDDDERARGPGRASREEADRLRRGTPPKRRRKGRMGQAIDVWLTQFGLKAPVQSKRDRPISSNPPVSRRQRPTLVPGEPVVSKRPAERIAPRPHRRGPTIMTGEPVAANRPAERITPRPPRREAPTITLNEPVPMKKRPAADMPASRAPRPNGAAVGPATGPAIAPATGSGAPAGMKQRPAEPTLSTPTLSTPARENLTIIHGDRIAMDLMKPGPVIPGPGSGPQQQMLLAKPGAALPAPANSETTAGKLIDRSRTGLMAGVSFILDHGAPPPPTDDGLTVRTRWSYERELRRGLRVLLVALGLGGGWMVFVPLAGAVVVPGNLVVQSNVKAIQHPTGGVVATINVQNGSHVQAGDLLVKLDPTQTQASLQMVSKQLDEVRAKLARLAAERDGLDHVEIPSALGERASEQNVASVLASEQTLFKARLSGRQGQKDLLQSKGSQLTEEISGLEAQVSSKVKQLELIQGELTGVQDLYDKRLVPLTRLTSLQREAARIDGERGQLESTIAETKGKIGEAQLQIIKLDQDFRTDVVKELSEAQAKEAELVERGVAARDQLDRIEIRAPTSGIIHQLNAHTIGGVVKAGDTVMEIVPDSDDLQIEAHVQPNDIDQVHTGQKAFVRLTAFDRQTAPQLAGLVSYVSADTTRDQQQANASYFTVRVVLPEEERRRLPGATLIPGMPAEVFMQTGSRSMMSYLFKPIADQMRRAFVER